MLGRELSGGGGDKSLKELVKDVHSLNRLPFSLKRL